MTRLTVLLAFLGTCLTNTWAGSPAPASNSVVQWNRLLLQMVRTPGLQPATVHPTRSFAIMHLAIYDAVNSIEGTHQSYLTNLSTASAFESEEAAAAAAAHEVLLQLYPNSQALVDAQFEESVALIPGGTSKNLGLALGQTVADRLLLLRTNDGALLTPALYVFGTGPGEFQSPAPTFPAQPQFPHWAHVLPFALAKASLFRPGPPPSLASSSYAAAYAEVKTLGITNSAAATADESLIGRFWNGAIQNYWNEIAQAAALDRGLTLPQTARLFALLNMTMADGVIAFYDAKYNYNFWRPVSAVRAADTDGNPDTLPDPAWLPEVGKTAPDPSYPGAHAVLSAAGAQVLSLFFGKDLPVVNVTSEVLPGVERSFTSFTAAAEEATLSRIYAGQHFRFDLEAGQQLGQAVADEVVGGFLLPAISVLRLWSAILGPEGISLGWTGGAAPYVVQARTALSGTSWTDLITTSNLTATVPANGPGGFFRIVGH